MPAQRVKVGTRAQHKPPECPECGAKLFTVHQNSYEAWRFNEETGNYAINESTTEYEATCPECEADVSNLFPDGVCNYRS